MLVPPWFEIVTLVILGAILLGDLTLVARRPHAPSLRECSLWVALYVALAIAFAVVLAAVSTPAVAGSFVAGWLTEYSLSVDNLFVFVIIMSRFAVPRGNQQQVLTVGIIVSLVLRGACILLGAAAIARCSWIFYLFGIFLVGTSVNLAWTSTVGPGRGPGENLVLRRVPAAVSVGRSEDGARESERRGRLAGLSPMVIVFLAIGSADLLFALDSIPAIFGLTKDPFIVFTATLFALMGLRQLYFLLGGLLDRLVYLSTGLSLILGFIGVKLVLEALHTNELPFLNGGAGVGWAPAFPIWVSLGFIFVVLAGTTVASLLASRAGHPRAPHPPQPPSANHPEDQAEGQTGDRAVIAAPPPSRRSLHRVDGHRRSGSGGPDSAAHDRIPPAR